MSVSRTKSSRGWEVKFSGGTVYFHTREEARAFARTKNPAIRPTEKVKTGIQARVSTPQRTFDGIVNDTVKELLSMGATRKQILTAFASL